MARPNRRDEMARLLQQRERRGLTYRELSDRCGVPAPTLSWWSWKLRKESREEPGFVELEIAAGDLAPAFEIEAPSGHVLRVPADFDAVSLRRLLEVLSSC